MLLSSCLSAAGSPDPVPAGDFALLVEDAVDFGDIGFEVVSGSGAVGIAGHDLALDVRDPGLQDAPLHAPDFHQGAFGTGALEPPHAVPGVCRLDFPYAEPQNPLP